MKKGILYAISIIVGGYVQAQTLVGTAPTAKNVVVEKFTGINCPQCPAGQTAAQTLESQYPGRVNLINMHSDYTSAGGANPSYYTKPQNSSHPDLRVSTYPIQQMIGATAFPTALVSRGTFPYTATWTSPYYVYGSTGYGIGTPGLVNAGAQVINNGGNSDVNIGVKTTWNSTTRQLTVDVELYYRVAQSVNNELNVRLIQNNIVGYQSNGGTSYNHKHTLRHSLTGLWGEVLTTPAAGQYITKQYIYTVPDSIGFGTSPKIPCIISDCQIVVYVTDNAHHNTHTGITVPAVNSQAATGLKEEFVSLSDVSVYPNPVDENSTIQFSLKEGAGTTLELYNTLGAKVLVHQLGDLSKGTHNFSLDFIINNKSLAHGMYLLKIDAGIYSSVVKISL